MGFHPSSVDLHSRNVIPKLPNNDEFLLTTCISLGQTNNKANKDNLMRDGLDINRAQHPLVQGEGTFLLP